VKSIVNIVHIHLYLFNLLNIIFHTHRIGSEKFMFYFNFYII